MCCAETELEITQIWWDKYQCSRRYSEAWRDSVSNESMDLMRARAATAAQLSILQTQITFVSKQRWLWQEISLFSNKNAPSVARKKKMVREFILNAVVGWLRPLRWWWIWASFVRVHVLCAVCEVEWHDPFLHKTAAATRTAVAGRLKLILIELFCIKLFPTPLCLLSLFLGFPLFFGVHVNTTTGGSD